jgi:MYXO-CTERM domain-containing protein
MRRLVLGLSVISCLFAAGCTPEAPRPAEQVRSVPLGIINGSLDTTHTAVVAIFSNQSVCSGTIVAVVGDEGYVLTAAHCVEDAPVQVVFTDDYNNAPFDNNVVSYAAHPDYAFPDYDFAMVKFSGASGATPIIPAMSDVEDNLTGTETVEFVGYGVTEDNFNNSLRMHVSGPLSAVDALHLEYEQSAGGPCSGDSGGPSLSLVNGQERVSGVTSYGDQQCVQYGVSGRVSAVNETFIQTFIANGGPQGGQTCSQCETAATSQNGACAGSVDACFANNACASLVQCINGCNDQACVDDCAMTYQAGVPLYNAIFDCICDVACDTECAAQCGGSSSSSTTTSSTTTSTSSGSTTSTGTTSSTTGAGGAGGTGNTSVGVGANDSSGAGNNDDDEDPSEDSGCRVGATGAPSPVTALGLLGLLVGLGSLRRRSRARS